MIFFSTEINFRLFEDDACLNYHYSDPEHIKSVINKELVGVDKWLLANKLFNNNKKQKILLFNNTPKNVN